MWTRSGISGTGPSPSKGDRKRTNGSSSSNSKKPSKSDSSKSSSRSLNQDSELSRSYGDQSNTVASKSSKYSESKGDQKRGLDDDEEERPNPPQLSHDSSLIPNQFPDQTPLDYSIPSIRPDTSSSGFGLAADYYNDQGESVHRQPGIRPHTPIVTGAEPHLMAALAQSNPPEETGHGAAAEFYNNDNVAPSEASYQTAQSQHQASYSSAMAAGAGTTGVIALAEGSGSPTASQPSTSQRPTSKSNKHYGSSIPLIAAGAAVGAAGLGAAAYAHHNHHNTSSQYDSKHAMSNSGGRRSSGRGSSTRSQPERPPAVPYSAGMTRSYQEQRHEHRGPVSKFVDWWKNYDDIRKMEEYTEYIGVCRYCFDPQSDPRDGPRKHRMHRRPSREFRDRRRVDKESRYARASSASSSDSEGANKGILAAAGLAGLGLASASKAKRRKEFDDSSIKSGLLELQDPLEAGQSRDNYDRRSSVSQGVTSIDSRSKPGRSRHDEQGMRGTVFGGAAATAADAGLIEAGAQTGSPLLRRKSSGAGTVRRRRGTSSAMMAEASSSETDNNPGFFEKIFSPRSNKTNKLRQRTSSGPYKNDSATSSLVSGLAYGQEDSQSRRGKARREPTARDASNAILGLGAAAALLASVDSKRNRASGKHPELIAVRESRNKPSKPPLNRDSLDQSQQQQSEDGWEDASDTDESSSTDTGLAFGDFHLGRNASSRRGSASVNSPGPATDKWDWRWSKKAKAPRRASPSTDSRRRSGAILPTIIASPPAVAEPIDGAYRHRADSAADYDIQGPLRYIDPRPMSDFNSPDIATVIPTGPLRADVRDVALQQPQPKPAVRAPVYDDVNQFDKFVSHPDDASAYPREPFTPGLSRVETLPDNFGDSPFPDGYSFPRRRRTDPVSSEGSRESPIGSHQIESPRKQSHFEIQNLARDAAITGAVAGVVGIAAGAMDRNERRSNRQTSQSVRFATEEPAKDNRRAANVSEVAGSRVQDEALVTKLDEPPIKMPEPVQKSGYDVEGREMTTDKGRSQSEPFPSSFPQLQSVEPTPSIRAAFDSGLAEGADLMHVQSEPQFEIRHHGQTRGDHEPILDDEIFDPNFFKRSRAASEPELEGRQRTASFVVADLENRYTTKSPSMAEFFAPPELTFPASALDRRVDADVDFMPPVELVDPVTGTRDISVTETPATQQTRAMSSIPRLNVIAPTPPSSYAGSAKDPLSRSTSPVVSAADVEEAATEDSARETPSSPSRVRWADQPLPEPVSIKTRAVEPSSAAPDTEIAGDFGGHPVRQEHQYGRNDAMNQPIPADDSTAADAATFSAISTTELTSDSSKGQDVSSYEGADVRPKVYMPGSFSVDEEGISPSANSPPGAYGLDRSLPSTSEIGRQQATDHEVIAQSEISEKNPSENWNDVRLVETEKGQTKSSKKSKKSKKRRAQPSTAPWEDEIDNDSGRRSRVPEEKVNTSFPGIQANPKHIPIDISQASPPPEDVVTDPQIDPNAQDNDFSPGKLRLSTDRSTDSLLELERGLKQSALPEETHRTSTEAYAFPESYRDVPEMIRLPDSRPGSPYGLDELSATHDPPEVVRSPTSPSLGRTPSATAVPLPFYRRTPQSPWSNRDSPVASSYSNEQSPTSATRSRTSRPSSVDFKSNEFRPLWLLERNRKATQPDSEEELPPLPSSHSTSRASSVLDSDEVFESAQESLEHSPVLQHGFSDPESLFDRDVLDVQYLDSQQATPKALAASNDNLDVPSQPLDLHSTLESEMGKGTIQPHDQTVEVPSASGAAVRGGIYADGVDGDSSHEPGQVEAALSNVEDGMDGASGPAVSSAQQPSIDNEDESWSTAQLSRGKKAKKAKKGKKGRPTPIQTSPGVDESETPTPASDLTGIHGVYEGNAAPTEPSLQFSIPKSLVTEPPLTARRDLFDGDYQSEPQQSLTETQEPTQSEDISTRPDGLVEGKMRLAQSGHESETDEDNTLRSEMSSTAKDVTLPHNRPSSDFDQSYPKAVEQLHRDTSGESIPSNPALDIERVSTSSYQGVTDDDRRAPVQRREEKELQNTPDEDAQLHPADFAMLESLINRRQSEAQEQGGTPEDSSSNVLLDNARHAINDTPTRNMQEPEDTNLISEPVLTESKDQASRETEIGLDEQHQAKEDGAEDFESISWISKGKKKNKKGKNGKQSLAISESEPEPQAITKSIELGNETQQILPIVADADDEWAVPSKSKKKKGKNRKSSLPLAAFLGASSAEAASRISEDPVEDYPTPTIASRVDHGLQGTAEESVTVEPTERLQELNAPEQSSGSRSIEEVSTAPTINESGLSGIADTFHKGEYTGGSPAEVLEDDHVDTRTFRQGSTAADAQPAFLQERMVADSSSPTEAAADDEWSSVSMSKKKKEKKKRKASRTDELPLDNFDDTFTAAETSNAKQIAPPTVASIEPTDPSVEDEWAMPSKSKSKKGKKQLRFSTEPDVDISAEPATDKVVLGESHKSVTFADEDTIPSGQIHDSIVAVEEQISTNIVPGAFPEEDQDVAMELNAQPGDDDTEEPSTRDFLDRLREEENQSPVPKNFRTSTSEGVAAVVSDADDATPDGTLERPTYEEQQLDTAEAIDTPLYGQESRPTVQRITTSDFLEELREEENQSPTPFATTASYAERDPEQSQMEQLQLTEEEPTRDLTNVGLGDTKVEDVEMQDSVFSNEDSALAPDIEQVPANAEDEWAFTPKTKKSKKSKKRNELEFTPAAEKSLVSTAETAETAVEHSSTEVPSDPTPRDWTVPAVQDDTITEFKEPADEWDLTPTSKKKQKKGKNKGVLEPLPSTLIESTTAEAQADPISTEETKSLKGKKGKKSKKSKKLSLFSIFQSKEEPKKSSSAKRLPGENAEANDTAEQSDNFANSSVPSDDEWAEKPTFQDTTDFMEQEDTMEEGFGDPSASEPMAEPADVESPKDEHDMGETPTMIAERAFADDPMTPGQYLDSDVEITRERNQVDYQNQRQDFEVEEMLEKERALEEDRRDVELDSTAADDDEVFTREVKNRAPVEVVGTGTILDEKTLEEDSNYHAADDDERGGPVENLGQERRPLSPVDTLDIESPMERDVPTLTTSKKSKKDKKKAKKAKKNQTISLDEFQSRQEADEYNSPSTAPLAQTPYISNEAESTRSVPEEYADTSETMPIDRTETSYVREIPPPLTASEVTAMPVFSSHTEQQVSSYDAQSVRRSQSISKLWPSQTSKHVELEPRSSSESRKSVAEDIGFASTLAAGLQASGFDPIIASQAQIGRVAQRSVFAIENDKSSNSIEETGKGLVGNEPSWSFNRLDEEEQEHPYAEREQSMEQSKQDEDSTFKDIISLGLGSAGFDPAAAGNEKAVDPTLESSRSVHKEIMGADNETGSVTMRTPSPKGPAEQWLKSSRRGSPASAKIPLEEPEHTRDRSMNRDSAMQMQESPLMNVGSPNQYTIRDSGYHDTMPTTPASRTSEYERHASDMDMTPPASPAVLASSSVESTSKERSSSLFQSPPHVTANYGDSTTYRDVSYEQSPIIESVGHSSREDLQATVEDEDDSSHPAYSYTGTSSGARPVSSTAHSRSQSRELDTIIEDSSERSTVEKSQQHPHNPESSATRVLAMPAPLGVVHSTPIEREGETSFGPNEISGQLSRSVVSPTASEVAISQRPYARSSNNASPVTDLVRPPSALGARSRTPGSVVSNRSGSQGLRRSNPSSDLGAEYKRREAQAPGYPANLDTHSQLGGSTTFEQRASYDPLKGLGRVSSRDMSDTGVYEGWDDVRESPRSPTRPQGVRKRQSLQIIDLENRLDQVMAENRSLQDSRGLAGSSHTREVSDGMPTGSRDEELRQRDIEISTIRASLETLQQEIVRLTEHNEQLSEANRNLSDDANERYGTVQAEHDDVHQQWQQTSRELEQERDQHSALRTGMEAAVGKQVSSALASKNAEIQSLRDELSAASEQIRSLQAQIQESSSSSRGISDAAGISNDFLNIRNDDYIDSACHQLCSHVQQWILRFSKFSDMRACRLSPDLHNESIEGRLDNAVLDGTDVDVYLSDRIKRRDVFMSLTMTMIWEYVFTRYLFGMDRTQRQTLKNLEKTLSEVGPQRAVAQWRATTLTLLSRRESFSKQREADTEAVVQEIFSTLSALLPPPHNLASQIVSSLRNVVRLAVDLSIEMRTQRPEYVMLPPLHPEYDTNGDLVRRVFFNASLMNERSGNFADNGALEVEERSVRIVLFPLVVRKGDELGEGSEEVVVAPAQVLVSRTEEEERRNAAATRGNGANSSARSVRGLGAEYNRSQMSIAPPGSG